MKVKKRNGVIVDFDFEKIKIAIGKAGVDDEDVNLNIQVNLEAYCDEILDIETIQDNVENVLMSHTYYEQAKKYILYREQRKNIREMAKQDKIELVDNYLGKLDWIVKENSNMGYSLQGLNNYISSEVTKNYWLNKIYPEEIRQSHKNGDIHIHDLNLLAPYCVGWDLEDILREGFKGVSGKQESSPAKHFQSALGQIVNFIYTLQGEAAGAQALSSFDTLLSPFIYYDGLSYMQVKQELQEFVFNMNTPTRVGFQTPFSNVTMDMECPEHYKDMPVIVGGEYKENTYKEFDKERKMINKAFAEVMLEGDAKGRIFTFPIPTYNITKDFDWNDPEFEPVWRMAGKYGIPYFSNFINSDMSPDQARSMCPLAGEHQITIVTESNNDTTLNRSFEDVSLESAYKNYGKNPFKVVGTNYSDIKKVIIHKFDNQDMMCISMANGEDVYMTPDHLNLVYNNGIISTKPAKDFIFGDMLPMDKDCIQPLDDGRSFLTDDYLWMRIDYFEVISTGDKTAYCLEVVDGSEPLFRLSDSSIITHNCRLRLDNRQLQSRGGGLFGSNPLTGSLNVTTINLPRLAYRANKEGNAKEFFFTELTKLMNICKACHVIKRKTIEYFTERDLYPYSKFYLRSVKERTGKYWSNHFSTIGLIGMNEACLNLLGKDLSDEESSKFALEVMEFMRSKLEEFQEQTGDLFNLEATPAEGTTYRLAQKDKKDFPEIIVANNGSNHPFYTNSTHHPVNFTDDIFELLDAQDELQTKYTGGTVIHLFLGENITNMEVVKNIIRKVSENYKLPYFTLSPTFSVCKNHGYLSGKQESCEKCGEETEIYSRVVGYYRPVKQWNDGKVAEFNMRKTFKS